MLQGKHIHQISAGRCHSAAWTAPSVPPRAPGEWHARTREHDTQTGLTSLKTLCSAPPSSSSGSSVPLQLGLPLLVPPQYGSLKEVSIEAVRARLRLLYHFSDLMYSSWRLLNLSPNNQVSLRSPHLRRHCFPSAPVTSVFVQSVSSSSVCRQTHGFRGRPLMTSLMINTYQPGHQLQRFPLILFFFFFFFT